MEMAWNKKFTLAERFCRKWTSEKAKAETTPPTIIVE
jgi:hypothetical protein